MIRWIFAALLLVKCPVFADDFEGSLFGGPLESWQFEAISYLGYGNTHLLNHEPWQALEYFQKALSLLNKPDEFSQSLSFLTHFSQIVAYDCLGLHELCKQSIGSLFIVLVQLSDEDDDDDEDEDDDEDLLAEEQTIHLLQNLAGLAPSPDIRNFLFTFIDQLSEE
jgi:DNA-directed RNA polymerase specialized sigma24 family protein